MELRIKQYRIYIPEGRVYPDGQKIFYPEAYTFKPCTKENASYIWKGYWKRVVFCVTLLELNEILAGIFGDGVMVLPNAGRL